MIQFLKKVNDKLIFYSKVIRANYYARNLLIDFDESWFKGKRVAVVGGADSLLEEPSGHYIDSFDVVVRINKGVELVEKQSEYAGTRTDVLFHSLYDIPSSQGGSPPTPELWKKYNVQKLIFGLNYKCANYPLNNFLTFLHKTKRNYKLSQVPSSIYFENSEILKPSGATMGFVALNTIIKCQPKELFITGITFFKTPHNSSYRNISENVMKETFETKKNHSADKEYQHIKKLYLQNSFIQPDKTLKEIFDTN